MSKTLVYYHGGCIDGHCAAWLIHKYLDLGEVEYIPINYGQEVQLDNIDNQTTLFVLDFSFEPDVLQQVIDKCSMLVLLDHHKTAEEKLKPFIEKHKDDKRITIQFDMTKSGARLTYDYITDSSKSPDYGNWLVDFTEDRDLWLWKLNNSREVSAALASYPMTFEWWDYIYNECTSSQMVEQGKAILRYQKQQVERAMKHVVDVVLLGDVKAKAVNSCLLQSEIGEELSKLYGMGVVHYINEDEDAIFSLRSSRESGIDVSEIAKRYGGGGHPNASGFKIKKGEA